jgi:NitT/TauT family transport system permease protein
VVKRESSLLSHGVEAAVWCILAAIAYTLAVKAPAALGQSSAVPDIVLRPSALPGYVGLSLARMGIAYVLSLIFTVLVGYFAAYNSIGGRLIPPALDVLQSIPVLSFLPAVLIGMLALIPGRVGLEVGSVILIFTGMVWNLTFSFYHSLLTIPRELSEASRMLALSPWRRFTTLELPVTLIGLIWNSVMSWAAGWFYLMASESFTLANRSYALPGLGSYLAVAANAGNVRAILTGVAVLVGVVILLDQLVWVPLVVWSDRFKLELSDTGESRRSWVLHALQRSRLLEWLGAHLWRPAGEWVDRRVRRFSRKPALRVARGALVILACVAAIPLVLAVGRSAASFVALVLQLRAREWLEIGRGTIVTTARVVLTLVITFAWTLPVGVAIGTRPGLARRVQPLVQIAASVPATALFPILLLLLLQRSGGLGLSSMILMLLGTQWYVLFNVIAGATALPHDLQEAAVLLNLRGMMKWRTFIVPAIFPFLVTGGITAQGGAFNAAVVSEYLTFGGRVIQTVGLGAVIAAAAANGNYPVLAAGTIVMAVIVVAINRAFWRPMARLAHERYHL